MEFLKSDDLIIIVVEDDLKKVNGLSLPVETIEEDSYDQSLLLENIKTEKGSLVDPLDVTVKIEKIENEFGDIDTNKNIYENIFSREPRSKSIVNIYSNTDSLVNEETQHNIQAKIEPSLLTNEDTHNILVKIEPSLLTNQEAHTDTQKYVEDVQDSEQEIVYLEEEYDENEGYIPENIVKNNKKKQPPEIINSYISDLILQFPELKEDDELFVEVLARIMKEVKAPPLPEKYYEVNFNKFNCVLCGATTHTLPAAERHYLEKHGSRYLVCYACGVTFRSRTNLYKHEKRCKATDIDIVLKARAIFLGGKGQNRPFLELYKRRVQENRTINIQKYSCTKCPAVYVSKQGLESHINKHLGRRPYSCDKCSNAYTCMRALKRHNERHENIQYTCDTCNRNFALKETLIVHMHTHLPMKKYGCPECDRRYANKHALTLHVNKIHRNLPYPFGCQICSKRYSRLSKLKDHMKREHGLNIMSRNMFMKKLPTLSEQDVLNAKVVMTSDHTLANKDPVILDD